MVLLYLLFIASAAWSFAFSWRTPLQVIGLFLYVATVDFLLLGVGLATVAWWLANTYLSDRGGDPGSSASSTAIEWSSAAAERHESVEWLYAFDVHCNAFLPLFLLLHVLQYLLLPLLLRHGFLAAFMSNSLCVPQPSPCTRTRTPAPNLASRGKHGLRTRPSAGLSRVAAPLQTRSLRALRSRHLSTTFRWQVRRCLQRVPLPHIPRLQRAALPAPMRVLHLPGGCRDVRVIVGGHFGNRRRPLWHSPPAIRNSRPQLTSGYSTLGWGRRAPFGRYVVSLLLGMNCTATVAWIYFG